MDNYLLAGIGSLISLLLMVNAFFTRKTLEKINAVDLKLAVLITDHKHTEKKADENGEEIKELKRALNVLRDECKSDIGKMRERILALESKSNNG